MYLSVHKDKDLLLLVLHPKEYSGSGSSCTHDTRQVLVMYTKHHEKKDPDIT